MTPAKKAPAKKSAPKKKAPVKKIAAQKAPVSEPMAPAQEFDETDESVDVVEDDLWGADDEEDIWDADWDDLGSFADGPGVSDPSGEPARDDSAHHLANEGVELFQSAALEMIAAARTALDAAEELVADPKMIGTAFESLRGIAAEALRAAKPGPRSHSTDDPDDDFQAIRVDDE
ncbi:MAG TPA: hypothetical protein VFN21_08360 [Acidimicrobiales bacterium]|nr:hypothetical protein [Acidimicrobiales bacterium]